MRSWWTICRRFHRQKSARFRDMGHARATPKAACWRVLFAATYHDHRRDTMLWWPIIAADDEQDAVDRLYATYGEFIRADIRVLSVIKLHDTHVHDIEGLNHAR